MKKLLTATLGIASILTFTLSALAASTNPVPINGVEIDSSGPAPAVYVLFGAGTAMPSGAPGCAGKWAQFDPSIGADGAKALTALATAAYLAGKTVRVNWTGHCTNDDASHTSYGYINDLVVTSGN